MKGRNGLEGYGGMDLVEKMDCRTKGEVIWGARKPLQPPFSQMPSPRIQMDCDKELVCAIESLSPTTTDRRYPTLSTTTARGKIMLNEQTFDKLYAMKLIGMAEGFKEQLEQSSFRDLSFEERFAMLADRQWIWKENKRLKRLLQHAKLKLQASLEDLDYRTPRGIEKSLILSLASCQWIRSHQNLLIAGPTGVGKTFLACAFAQKACREGFRTFYLRSPQFFYQIALARADGSYGTLMKRLSKTHLLVLDDLGLAPLTDTERRDLLEVVEDRSGSTSTLITSQLPIDHWHDHIGDPTIADAIMDRLIHNAHRIQLKGGSMRKKQKLDGN
jgi:DNA replication protein DnaC